MKRLLAQDNIGGRIERWWSHTDDYGNTATTVEAVQDVEPVFEAVKRQADLPRSGDFRYRATIPATVIEDVSKLKASEWGIGKFPAFQEIMAGKTDRSQQVWAEVLYGRDYRRFQAQ